MCGTKSDTVCRYAAESNAENVDTNTGNKHARC